MKKENIDNLTSLWETVGASMGSYYNFPMFNCAIVRGSEWPNRVWLNNGVNIEAIGEMVRFLSQNPNTLTFPYWDVSGSDNSEVFELLNLRLKFKQVGMSKKLTSKFEYEERLMIKQITNQKEVQEWENIYPEAFGYKISKETLLATNKKINYYLAILNKAPIGTAIVYNTNNISGIHGVGVIPSARRKGFAEEIMKYVINKAIDDKMEYSTLQASDMGKGIYLRLGYSEDFTINNFVLNE